MSKFSTIPQVRFNRTKFDLSHTVKTSFNVGDLVPLDIQEVLPGDSFSCKMSGVIRVSSSFIRPVMDNMFMDVHHFFIPLRLCYEDAEKIFGNPSPSAYTVNQLKDVPTVHGQVHGKTVGDYMGLPLATFSQDNAVNVLPFRAFALVYNQWFRNQNVVDETFVQLGDTNSLEVFNNNPWSANNYLGKLPKVSKKKDYFTSCLPNPQKGEPIKVPIGNLAPVIYADTVQTDAPIDSSFFPVRMKYYNESEQQDETSLVRIAGGSMGDLPYLTLDYSYSGESSPVQLALKNGPSAGLFADLGDSSTANVNDIRLAFALQRMLERDALYGSRYNEYLLGHFSVSGGDSRLQFTEYLGGGRINISIQSVAQTSQPTEESPLGALAGYSLSNGYSKYSKGFVEHGFVLTVGCVKQFHTYSQGVPKMFMRKDRNDFYDPLFATLGEQPVYTSEIFFDGQGENTLKGDILGYNEAWADYRYKPAQITGELRPSATNTLDVWHFGDKFDNAPILSQRFIEESADFVDRTLSVPSTSMDNFIADLWFDTKAIRVMPAYSIPGLVDHH